MGFTFYCFTIVQANISTTNISNSILYEIELEKLNAFLEDFEDGFFGHMEVVDGFVIIHFKEGNYSKFKVEDMTAPVLDTKWGQINWDCKNGSLCVETDWNDEGKESGILFQEMGGSNLDYLMDLLNYFISAYNNK
jgi:hypothetical protein